MLLEISSSRYEVRIIVLYCTVLYCTVLYCTVLYCTVLYCTVLYCTVLYCTVLYCTVLYPSVYVSQILVIVLFLAPVDINRPCQKDFNRSKGLVISNILDTKPNRADLVLLL